MLTEVKKILPFCANKLGLGIVLEFHQLFLNWDKILTGVFGDNYQNISRPISLKNKTLIIDCLNSVWASELQFKQEIIINQVNKFFNKEAIKEIRFIC